MTASILVTRKWPAEVEALLAGRFGAALNDADVPMTAAALGDAMARHDVICPTVTDRITADMLDRPDRRVRLLCNYGAGVDHIDLDACRRNGVTVTNTPDVLTDATAEIAILLMLMAARRADEGARELREGRWTGWRPTHMIGTQLAGKTLGLIGFGRIAQATAHKARALGMDIVYHSRRRADPAIEQALEARFEAELGGLLAAADMVSLHMPGGAATERFIGAAELAAMRPTAILINTARGSVVDEGALARALHAGTIAAAGLDVFVGEPVIAPALLDAPNLVMLPHLGSATREARAAMGMRALANLDAWLAEDEPADRVA
ncbi:2-hydroxyacid dehydrogenase [Sphingomonas colocasiae]|uniref:D-glycerate dehydrogenase n=1 Tax=Sphingomonas colocasiae TaxID=1848973 RepID=A0ABS7PMY4_9SPHN|nr:D-glycerate dehydrogenase [Sphingomonas colocasiae]MBY8822075.1 D-glycerate dehydrogenase [Sphingomonas colocasiae]